MSWALLQVADPPPAAAGVVELSSAPAPWRPKYLG
jgi:hypothetical protein